jgi:hypothetical protein
VNSLKRSDSFEVIPDNWPEPNTHRRRQLGVEDRAPICTLVIVVYYTILAILIWREAQRIAKVCEATEIQFGPVLDSTVRWHMVWRGVKRMRNVRSTMTVALFSEGRILAGSVSEEFMKSLKRERDTRSELFESSGTD